MTEAKFPSYTAGNMINWDFRSSDYHEEKEESFQGKNPAISFKIN